MPQQNQIQGMGLGQGGPFSEMLMQQLQQPIARREGDPNAGWASGWGNAARVASNVLEGVRDERVKDYVRQKAEREEGVNNYLHYINTAVANNPNLTDEAKSQLMTQAAQDIFGHAAEEVSKSPKGGIGEKIKGVLTQMAGGKLPKVEPLNAYERIGQIQSQIDPKTPVHPEYQRQYWIDQANTTLAAEKAKIVADQGPNFDPALLNAALAPTYSVLAEKLGPEYAQRFQATALAGVVSPGQRLKSELDRQVLQHLNPTAGTEAPGQSLVMGAQPEAYLENGQPVASATSVVPPATRPAGATAGLPLAVESRLVEAGLMLPRERKLVAVNPKDRDEQIDVDQMNGTLVYAGTSKPIPNQGWNVYNRGTAPGGERPRLVTKENGVQYIEQSPGNWQPVWERNPDNSLKLDDAGQPIPFRPAASPMYVDVPGVGPTLMTPGRATATPGAIPASLPTREDPVEKEAAKIYNEALRQANQNPILAQYFIAPGQGSESAIKKAKDFLQSDVSGLGSMLKPKYELEAAKYRKEHPAGSTAPPAARPAPAPEASGSPVVGTFRIRE
jgi:hypothetical protein